MDHIIARQSMTIWKIDSSPIFTSYKIKPYTRRCDRPWTFYSKWIMLIKYINKSNWNVISLKCITVSKHLAHITYIHRWMSLQWKEYQGKKLLHLCNSVVDDAVSAMVFDRQHHSSSNDVQQMPCSKKRLRMNLRKIDCTIHISNLNRVFKLPLSNKSYAWWCFKMIMITAAIQIQILISISWWKFSKLNRKNIFNQFLLKSTNSV